jgi:signal transduction histidine kinase
MFYDFLEKYRSEIIILSEEKTLKLAGPLLSSVELKKGLPLFLDLLINYLKRPTAHDAEREIVSAAAKHGKELMNLNYTLSHVVHSYGSMCQAITELAQRYNADVSTQDFNDLNMCLDIAIASAVSEFEFLSTKVNEDKELQHLGFLAHELRNALSNATIAHEMIKQGLVGTSGSTSRVLGDNLSRMRHLIDRSLSDVRMRADPIVYVETFQLIDLIEQILLTAKTEAKLKQLILKNDIRVTLKLETDRQLLLSVIANLIQNAIKYSKAGGTITVRAGTSGKNVLLEIEDACGGINEDMMQKLFKPFTSGCADHTGMGLGLTIVQRAVSLLQGTISVSNQPGHSCAFKVEIPMVFIPTSSNKPVSGDQSVQPEPDRPTKK